MRHIQSDARDQEENGKKAGGVNAASFQCHGDTGQERPGSGLAAACVRRVFVLTLGELAQWTEVTHPE